jgi:hypothetical protein
VFTRDLQRLYCQCTAAPLLVVGEDWGLQFALLGWVGFGRYSGARGSVVVKALCYKAEGRGFDSR